MEGGEEIMSNERGEMQTKVICGFPGVGKTYYRKHSSRNVLDSDSSTFSWLQPGVRNPEFPANYMDHIQEALDYAPDDNCIVLVSSHAVVREALHKARIPFTLVYPDINSKEEYLKRYADRGSDDSFVKLLDTNWNEWIKQMQEEKDCEHIVMLPGEHLTQAMCRLEAGVETRVDADTMDILGKMAVCPSCGADVQDVTQTKRVWRDFLGGLNSGECETTYVYQCGATFSSCSSPCGKMGKIELHNP
jgi:hypothetical protein